MGKNKKTKVQGVEIVLHEDNKEDFISLHSDYLLQNRQAMCRPSLQFHLIKFQQSPAGVDVFGNGLRGDLWGIGKQSFGDGPFSGADLSCRYISTLVFTAKGLAIVVIGFVPIKGESAQIHERGFGQGFNRGGDPAPCSVSFFPFRLRNQSLPPSCRPFPRAVTR